MAHYSIKDLEQLSGIKAHTIRIWEKRYQLIKPGRTQTNIRLYSDDDLRRILNVSILSRHGFKISRIAAFHEEEISEKILHLSQNSPSQTDQVEALVVAMIELDESKFNRILSASVTKIGFEDSFIQVIFPFLEKIGMLWQAGTINPAQEHFITNLIRQRLIVSIDGAQSNYDPNAKKFLLFMQEGDSHELGLLFFHYMLARRGQKVLYLGSSVPYNDIPRICSIFHPDFLVTLFVSPIDEEYYNSYLKFVAGHPGSLKAFISGQQVVNAGRKLPHNISLVKNPHQFSEELKKVLPG
jgi:MerR family transcriptional regulator, light-induced transcriptional regulator